MLHRRQGRVMAAPYVAAICKLTFCSMLQAGVTIDFDAIANPVPTNHVAGPYVEDGFILSNTHVTAFDTFYMFGPGESGYTGQKALTEEWQPTTTTLAQVGGGAFD